MGEQKCVDGCGHCDLLQLMLLVNFFDAMIWQQTSLWHIQNKIRWETKPSLSINDSKTMVYWLSLNIFKCWNNHSNQFYLLFLTIIQAS